ncbi:hypothetical protein [Parapedobacter koreensis]|uniref:Beta-galactosidase n=1 Tax=Parapedobacter koreensis TaxID=332977 RepID=A0A1H7IIC3_9SPHI|nr:hypothetical protein [Parapedobacter koreensis]SEK62251.1 hypothetical protein SAMN05421740_102252 [Parapedobacter koreensis]
MEIFRLNRMSSALLALCFGIYHIQCSERKGTPIDTDYVAPPAADTISSIKFKDMLGINGFEWEFLNENNEIDAEKTALIKPFGGFRHYLDWNRIETEENVYAYQPSLNGNWGYDDIYQWCKTNGIPVLVCLKTIPDWLRATYPEGEDDYENAPLPYGQDKADPASYRQFAKLGFQFAARYGHNAQVDTGLVSVSPDPAWSPNQRKIGLGLVTYIECNNEPDRTWKGENAHQTAEEYAANLSAFYDGHLGQLGPGVGVKNADPEMQVVMGGLTKGDVDYLSKMIEWCRVNRGLKEDGTVNLCFDVINYHHYSFSNEDLFAKGTRGRAPERSSAAEAAIKVVSLAKEEANGTPVWITELGYDVNKKSPLRTLKIKDKSPLITHADWSLRSSLLYARHGIKRLHFYMLNDVDIRSSIQFSSSGFVQGSERKPAADYFLQANELMGEYAYLHTLNSDPIVDVYALDDKRMYVLMVPDEQGREVDHELEMPEAEKVKIYTLQVGQDKMAVRIEDVVAGKLKIHVTETPVFVEPIGVPGL